MRIRTANNRKRRKASIGGTFRMVTIQCGPTWVERGATGDEIIADLNTAMASIAAGYEL